MAKIVVQNYLGLWEMLNNPNFNPHIYEGFKNESAKPHFWMSPQKWITKSNCHTTNVCITRSRKQKITKIN